MIIKNWKQFNENLNNKLELNESLSKLQIEYRNFFRKMLKCYDVKSPSDLSEEKKKEFFDNIKKYWIKGKGVSKNFKYFEKDNCDKNINEDVYWGSKNIYETDKEMIERIQNWVENYVDEQVGIDIMNVAVTNISISVHNKKGHRYEDRKHHVSHSDIPREEIKKIITDDWKSMAEDMIDEMKRDDVLFLEEEDYYIKANVNGYYIESDEEFTKKIIGSKPIGGFGG